MCDDLLKGVYDITQNSQKTQSYNVFQVLEIADREVLMCRVLADFLNPSGMHGKGTRYLKIFLNDVLRRPDAEAICESARVYKEYPITADRRIDIVIASNQVFIPIEVKIYAADQQAQCYDYFQFSKKTDAKPKVIYLTIWGNMPCEHSLKNQENTDCLSEEDVLCISFAEHIRKWLDDCLAVEDDANIKLVLKQYKEAIEEFAGSFDETLQMKLVDKIMETEENFRGMLAISEVAGKAKAQLIYQLLDEMRQAISVIANKYHMEEETDFRWYCYQEQADESFYSQRESTYPGINYRFTDVELPDDIQLWLRVEIDYSLFFGFCLFDPHGDNGRGQELDAPSGAIKNALSRYMGDLPAAYDGWWVKWWYIPTGTDQERIGRDLVPDFKRMNEAAAKLSDRKKRAEFIEAAIKLITTKLDRIR